MKPNQSIVGVLCPSNHIMFGGEKLVPFLQCNFNILEQNTLIYRDTKVTSYEMEMVFKMDPNSVRMMPRDPTIVDDITINYGGIMKITNFFGTYFEVISVDPTSNVTQIVLIGYGSYEHD